MKEQGEVISPSEPGIDWVQVSNGFPGQELFRYLTRLQERVLELELENVEFRQARAIAANEPVESAQIFDSAGIGYIELDHTTAIFKTNKVAAELLGLASSELKGKELMQFVAPGQAEVLRGHLQECEEKRERLATELVIEPPDRAQVTVIILCLPPLEIENQKLLRIAVADVTEVKRAEQKVLQLASFAALNPNPVLEFSGNGTMTWFNDAALDLAKFMGLDSPLHILPAEAPELVRECLRSGESRLRQETIIGERHLYWSFFPILPARVVHCYGTDLTERLNLEAQLQQTKKLETIGQLAANVAHDFNNVLGIIQGYTSLLLSQPGLASDMAESLKQISSASERATHLTRQLMTFSRKQVLEPAIVDLNELLQNLGLMLRRSLGGSISEQLILAPGLPNIQADPAMIEQVVLNLAMNAREAMPRGGRLTIETAPVKIDEDYVRKNPEGRVGQFVRLTVKDTGEGMDPETVHKIFEPFFTTKESGLGLGLSTVYGIVKQHQGWIEVQSHLGNGSVFQLFLPIVPLPAKPERIEERREGGGNETILIVEDEPALRELASRQLRRYGYRILAAANGTEALSLWPQHAKEVDLLFTDMVMPDGMTGCELAETLLAQKPELKVVYTSGYSLDVLEQDFALRRTVNFLQKPYHQETLVKSIRTTLDAAKGA